VFDCIPCSVINLNLPEAQFKIIDNLNNGSSYKEILPNAKSLCSEIWNLWLKYFLNDEKLIDWKQSSVTVRDEYPSNGAQFYMEAMKKRLPGGRKCRGDDCIKIYVSKTGLEGGQLFYLTCLKFWTLSIIQPWKKSQRFVGLDMLLSLAGEEKGTT